MYEIENFFFSTKKTWIEFTRGELFSLNQAGLIITNILQDKMLRENKGVALMLSSLYRFPFTYNRVMHTATRK